MSAASPTVVVVGSLNLDYIASVETLPAAGQTIAASNLIRRFGGKGANQAVAAARQGAVVRLIGCVGADDDGIAYLRRLRAESIQVAAMARCKQALTGTALIAVDSKGENVIIVAPGANGQLRAGTVLKQKAALGKAKAVLLQFEIPMRVTLATIRCANLARVPVILNPSPLRDSFPWGKCAIDTLIVNAGEAKAIFGLSLADSRQTRAAWGNLLGKHRISRLIITRGAASTLCLSGNERLEVPTLPVKPIDTVGAGDAFTGTFTACRAEGLDVLASIRLANCAGALATLRSGAQEAIPGRAVTEKAARKFFK